LIAGSDHQAFRLSTRFGQNKKWPTIAAKNGVDSEGRIGRISEKEPLSAGDVLGTVVKIAATAEATMKRACPTKWHKKCPHFAPNLYICISVSILASVCVCVR